MRVNIEIRDIWDTFSVRGIIVAVQKWFAWHGNLKIISEKKPPHI